MSHSSTLRRLFQAHRPAGLRGRGDKYLDDIAWRLRKFMEQQHALSDPRLRLTPENLDQLALATVEMAEDLHTDTGLWRSLEQYQQVEFGVPLPLVMRSPNPLLELFDERRFLFFFHTLWRHWLPDLIVAPKHRDLEMLTRNTREFLENEFENLPKDSGIRAFLATSNAFGWEVKKKLIWLGCHSYLFRDFFAAYLEEQKTNPTDIPVTDDFLCQQCTGWMGLGAIDILAAALDLSSAQRTELRGWHERHLAFYHVATLEMTGRRTHTLNVVNVINEQPYRIRLEMENAPFVAGQLIFGSLIPWRGEWYWSGQQQTYSEFKPDMIGNIKKEFLEKQSLIACRYCPDLAEKARCSVRRQQEKWMAHYGQDLAVFPDGLSLAAEEQRRLKVEFNAANPIHMADREERIEMEIVVDCYNEEERHPG
ncbi:MAG: DUF3843 family protein [Verrucomicrobiae bacterium]|nr:DUF3843 family protein [Verrucomicrobiae bacterium]